MSGLPEFSRPVEVSAIGAAELFRKIEASEQDRLEIASALGLVDLGKLIAVTTLMRQDNGTIHLGGRVSAEIVQSCVVSLDPVTQTIEEEISLDFVQQRSGKEATTKAAEIFVDSLESDPPEILSGPVIDLGPIVLECFILAIDPYPRAPGVVTPANPAKGGEETPDSPFAVLEKLGLSKPEDE